MRFLLPFICGALLLLSYPAHGVNPTIPIKSIDAARGFAEFSAVQDAASGMTAFRILIASQVFLSKCEYRGIFGAPDRIKISLCALNSETFKGVTVDLGDIDSKESKFMISFTVPSRDLPNYQLQFQGLTDVESNAPSLSNGMYYATLSEIRNAKEAVTEASPIWEELRKQHETMRKTEAFGSGSSIGAPKRRTEQDGAGQPATSPVVESEGGEKPQPEAEGRSR